MAECLRSSSRKVRDDKVFDDNNWRYIRAERRFGLLLRGRFKCESLSAVQRDAATLAWRDGHQADVRVTGLIHDIGMEIMVCAGDIAR